MLQVNDETHIFQPLHKSCSLAVMVSSILDQNQTPHVNSQAQQLIDDDDGEVIRCQNGHKLMEIV